MGAIAAISLVDLWKTYKGQEVLRGVSLVAEDHDVVTIVGSSGSGKTTLLRCINLLEIPDAGEIWIKDELVEINRSRALSRPVRAKQVQRLRRMIGMVFQQFNLWSHMTILENVIEAPIHVLGLSKKEAIERADHYLNKVGLLRKKNEYPIVLSGGETQRAAIARALAIEPKVVLLDEPTSALDPELVGEVLGVIRGIVEEGRTVVMVTHEMQFAFEISTQILFLQQGKIAEQGPPGTIMTAPKTEAFQKFLMRFSDSRHFIRHAPAAGHSRRWDMWDPGL
jgi:arginine/ornithine transport system ATP-binding protein